MLYYDDRDYYNADNIDELYENEDIIDYAEETVLEWEYDYHNLTDELVDD